MRKLLVICLVMAGLQACVRATTTPSLPPGSDGTLQSPAQDAIQNSSFMDQEKAAARKS